MSIAQQGNMSSGQPQKAKNIKNIYVHKINSLIKLSGDQITDQSLQLSSLSLAKKVRKVNSEGKLNLPNEQRNALKLEKNRQSAKKARQRKKIYIQLLENQVQAMKNKLSQWKQVEQSSQSYLQLLRRQKRKFSHPLEDEDVDKYFLNEQAIKMEKEGIQNENKLAQMHEYTQEISQFWLPSFVVDLQCQDLNFNNVSEKSTNAEEKLQSKSTPSNQRQLIQKIHDQTLNFHKCLPEIKNVNNDLKELMQVDNQKLERQKIKSRDRMNQLLEQKVLFKKQRSEMTKQQSTEKKQANQDFFISTSQAQKTIISFEGYINRQSF